MTITTFAPGTEIVDAEGMSGRVMAFADVSHGPRNEELASDAEVQALYQAGMIFVAWEGGVFTWARASDVSEV